MNNKRMSRTSLKLPKISYSQPKVSEKQKGRETRPEENGGKLTAGAYGIYKANLHPVAEFNSTVRREIASLTKMMTMVCTVRLCQKYKINMKRCYFRVTMNAAGLRGTSAELEYRQWAAIEDLLHGLMLPSGNDAATVLAQNLGACMYYDRLGEAHLLVDLKSLDLTEDTLNIKSYTEQFIKKMNSTAREIGMKESNYANPHGLDCSSRLEAYSTIEDQAILAKYIIEQPQCSRIMSTHEHTGELKTIIGKEVEIRKKTWKNTHLLMYETGFIGGKTGQTTHAGNCLASLYESKQKTKYIIVVLGCTTKEQRFTQTRDLVSTFIIGQQN